MAEKSGIAGGALAVYLQLPDEDKENVEKLKNALLAAFEVDQFIAYEQFITRRLNPGELPDVFLADLQRLASLFGGVSERQLSCAFVTGLPDDVRRLLRAGSRIEEFSLAQLVTRARAVLTNNPFISKLDAGLAIGEPRMIPKRKREWGGRISAVPLPHLTKALPVIRINVDGVQRRALIDTGCTRCIAYAPCCTRWRKQRVNITTVSGEQLSCIGIGFVSLELPRRPRVMVEAIIAPKRPLDLDFIIGMSGTVALGGVTVDGEGRVQFGLGNPTICASADTRIHIDKKDFSATYDPVTHVWTVAWKWSNGLAPGQLCNTREEYTPAVGIRKPYKEELNRWIHNGWLVPYNEEELGPAKALIPLLAVTQRSKGKVRPVLDFRELNTHIAAFTGNSDVCAHKLREWRRQGENVSILDLKQAYLQIHVDKSLWPYQTVIIDGRRHCLTRLGFGLNVAPIIMTAVVNCVLSRDADIQRATSAYIDDIFVNENVVEANRVKQHLADYGLAGQQNARWTYVDKRNQSQCVAGAVDAQDVAFIKREANSVTSKWDEPIDDDRIREQLNEVANAVKNQDPARGHWEVSGDKAKLWVDASTLAIGVMLEVNGVIVEDAAWLRPEDACHINMAELDAAIRGLNLAISWHMKQIELITDSLTVQRWLNDGLSGKARLRTKAANEMLIRRRVATIIALVEEYELQFSVTLVPSAENKADILTRVPHRWMTPKDPFTVPACASALDQGVEQLIAEVHHSAGHPGMRRTLYFARRRNPTISKRSVRQVISTCNVCQSIDPAPVKWKHGHLEVDRIWQRIGMDFAHCGGKLFLTLIDCGPSRFSIWRPLRFRTTAEVIEQLETIFYEHGAPEEILTDNDTVFRSQTFADFLNRWGVRIKFRCAYVPSGNGIVERCHRTIKVIVARKKCSVREAVYLYNITPRDDRTAATAPANVIYRYLVRVRDVDPVTSTNQDISNRYNVGDEVWIRPLAGRCDTRYEEGTVTNVLSDQAVEIDGIPRHVRDIRRRAPSPDRQEGTNKTENEAEEPLLIRVPIRGSNVNAEPPAHLYESGEHLEQTHSADQGTELPAPQLRRSKRIRQQRGCSVCD
ncbi:hypothetical protein M513_06471 [Trichuris suis]|uniref:RNA-directed DNA polymerase n=1 Tax=Trichuris suis TaxID=68888 RepID=A0A085M5X8_9BILA|nr:hypothetical protein M513_06471 [Trichuris suis]